MIARTGEFSTQIRVRYAETDKLGVAYNSHYLTWFEVGRTELMRKFGMTYEELEQNKITVKDMSTGRQELVDYDEFWSGLKS